MPDATIRGQRQAFLAGQHVAVMSVVQEHGRPPYAVPVFYHYEPGGEITFFTTSRGTPSRKIQLIEAARAVTMCVQDETMPYRTVSAECEVVGITTDPEPGPLLAIVGRYMPDGDAVDFVESMRGQPETEVTLFSLTPQRWYSFGISAAEFA